MVATGIRTQFFAQSIHLTLLSSTSSLPLSRYRKGYLSAILGSVSLVIRIKRRLTPSSIPDSISLLFDEFSQTCERWSHFCEHPHS